MSHKPIIFRRAKDLRVGEKNGLDLAHQKLGEGLSGAQGDGNFDWAILPVGKNEGNSEQKCVREWGGIRVPCTHSKPIPRCRMGE